MIAFVLANLAAEVVAMLADPRTQDGERVSSQSW